jgi:hypothetical protein
MSRTGPHEVNNGARDSPFTGAGVAVRFGRGEVHHAKGDVYAARVDLWTPSMSGSCAIQEDVSTNNALQGQVDDRLRELGNGSVANLLELQLKDCCCHIIATRVRWFTCGIHKPILVGAGLARGCTVQEHAGSREGELQTHSRPG